MRVCLFDPDPAWLTGELVADLMEVCRGAAEAKALQPEVDSEPDSSYADLVFFISVKAVCSPVQRL